MSVISDLCAALLQRGTDSRLRGQLREQLLAADSWDWPLLHEFVLANPASDGPRLLAADWLEDDGEADRAEFIRLQCRWAFRQDVYGGGADGRAEVAALRAALEGVIGRLRETLTADLDAPDGARIRLGDDGTVTVQGGEITLEFSRGFVGRIELPTPRFLSLAGDLFRRHPITSVRLTDKGPVRVVGGQWWWADTCLDPTEPACLARCVPPELYRHLTGSVSRDGRPRQGVNPADLTFPTREAAEAALSAACVGYGREQSRR